MCIIKNERKSKSVWMGVFCYPINGAAIGVHHALNLALLSRLHNCGVLSDEEFLEQKSFTLNIRSINTRK